ncbi:hypothetical protein C8Q74DRAFT_1222085 [Fomes fomentarius]|nr:hypothetical protein C8Q74DRAFT_1222085 [Fomes fomentarius]
MSPQTSGPEREKATRSLRHRVREVGMQIVDIMAIAFVLLKLPWRTFSLVVALLPVLVVTSAVTMKSIASSLYNIPFPNIFPSCLPVSTSGACCWVTWWPWCGASNVPVKIVLADALQDFARDARIVSFNTYHYRAIDAAQRDGSEEVDAAILRSSRSKMDAFSSQITHVILDAAVTMSALHRLEDQLIHIHELLKSSPSCLDTAPAESPRAPNVSRRPPLSSLLDSTNCGMSKLLNPPRWIIPSQPIRVVADSVSTFNSLEFSFVADGMLYTQTGKLIIIHSLNAAGELVVGEHTSGTMLAIADSGQRLLIGTIQPDWKLQEYEEMYTTAVILHDDNATEHRFYLTGEGDSSPCLDLIRAAVVAAERRRLAGQAPIVSCPLLLPVPPPDDVPVVHVVEAPPGLGSEDVHNPPPPTTHRHLCHRLTTVALTLYNTRIAVNAPQGPLEALGLLMRVIFLPLIRIVLQPFLG